MDKLITLLLISIFLLNTTTGYSQKKGKESKLTVDSFSFSDPSDNNQHKYFTLSYGISKNLFAEIHGYYDNVYITIDVFRVPIRAKKYLSDKFYFFSGFEAEYHIKKDTSEIFATLYKFINGVGYEVNSNFSMEVKQDYNLNTITDPQFINFTGGPNLFKLKAKYKF
ncbi:hypothetical protein [Aquimarina sp. MMG016]|uniref:hypothetical protein n=1 Tax=Aquimarina sp. MMG016 TaxID=2822690 RepID=UPI001B3A3114|nr:hypothetical protein [Aquimarina sp. MMG016]MBQ4819473.1 hypothetical protein [Aquimarina sp. MMG016]